MKKRKIIKISVGINETGQKKSKLTKTKTCFSAKNNKIAKP